MKKTLCIILATLLLISALPSFSATDWGDLIKGTVGKIHYYVEDDGTATVYGHTLNAGGHIVIPDTLDGYPVRRIKWGAFSENESLLGITIPEGVTEIGSRAFYGCPRLTTINLPSTLTKIEQNAFDNTPYARSSQNYVDGILYIGTNLIKINKYDIPDSVTVLDGTTCIADEAFKSCITITDVTLPNSIRSIGKEAFSKCTALESINLENNIEILRHGAFSSCVNLKSVNIPSSLKTLEQSVFSSCKSLKEITIPDSITRIERSAFQSCENIKSFVIPESVKEIYEYVFYKCNSLESLTLPTGLEYLGHNIVTSTPYADNPENIADGAIYNGKYLLSSQKDISGRVIIKDGTEMIANSAFAYKTGLTSVYIPDSVKIICNGAFIGAENLTRVRLPASLDEIPKTAFRDCVSLSSITIPETVTAIGIYAFHDCESMKSITVPPSVTEIGENALGHYTLYDGAGDMVMDIPPREDFTIRGIKGSTAAEYAAANGIKFEEIKIGTLKGDADGDGTLTVKDATAIQKHLAELQIFLSEQLPVCDANDDEKLTISDATAIQKHVAGI